MKSVKITKTNHSLGFETPAESAIVRGKFYNDLKDDFDALRPSDTSLKANTISEVTAAAGVTVDGVLIKDNTITALKESVTEVTTTVVLTAAMSGKVFFNNADSGASAFTLPAPSAGLHYKWIWAGDKATATSIATADLTDTSGDMFVGGLLVSAAAAVNTFVEAGANVNTMTFDDDVENGAAGVGSWVEIYCTEDPTWVVTGVINSTTDNNGVGSAIFSNAN